MISAGRKSKVSWTAFRFYGKDFFGAKCVEAHGNWVGVSDGVCKLDLDPVGQACRDDIFWRRIGPCMRHCDLLWWDLYR